VLQVTRARYQCTDSWPNAGADVGETLLGVSLRRVVLVVGLLAMMACDGRNQPSRPTEPARGVPAPSASTSGSSSQRAPSLKEARAAFASELVPRAGEREPVAIPPPKVFQLVRYPSAAGQLAAYLTPDPGDGKRHPAIVWITGGDCNSIGDVWSPQDPTNDQSASAYREAGIVTLFPSLRGGNDNPGKKEAFLGEVDDVLAAAEHLAKQPYVDPARIYLGGHSTGGTLVLLVAEYSDRFRAVFSFGPVEDVAGYGDAEFLPFDLSKASNREIEVRSPIHWLAGIRTPVFVIEGTGHGNVSSLRTMAAASTNAHVRFLAVEGADHFALLAPTNRLIAQRILRDDGPASNLSFTEAELTALQGGAAK
jgi:dipeptidyl aminopeptidase/acylaminoacyl peptidase